MPLMSQKEYALHIGKSKQYVNKLVKQGRIALTADGKIDSDVADAALAATADPARAMPAAVPAAVPAGDGPVTYHTARAEREQHQAALAKIELDRQRGQLVDKSDVEREAFAAARLVRDRILALPAQVAGELASMADEAEIVALLRRRLKEVLTEASQDVRGSGGDV